jgi:predicted nucleic acid-binding protein
MKVLIDTGPLVSTIDEADPAHRMASIAERHELPIFTFDFADFRATESASGPWRLAIDEDVFRREIR